MSVWKKIAAIVCLTVPMMSANAAAEATPHEVLKTATDTLLAKIIKEKETLKKDPQALYQLVEENITPFVDVSGIARGVMGQYFREATPEQRAAFLAAFKKSLVRTYAKGLTSYDNQKITFKPARMGKDPKKAQVDIEVHAGGGQVYPVTFEMRLNKSGAWKVSNILLNGINLGLTFRNQFAAAVNSGGGSIDKAIAAWSPEPKAGDSKSADTKPVKK